MMSAALEITSPELSERMQRSKAWRRALVADANGRCHYCNRTGVSDEIGPDDRPWHVDHKTPLARGGSNDDKNLVLACKRCNLTKYVQPYEQFRAFARAAFWVPDDWRVAEFDLDKLMERYDDANDGYRTSGGQDLTWRVDFERFAIDIVDSDGDRHTLFGWDPQGHPEYWDQKALRAEALSHLHLIADMHRLLPALIAEIRMLRADSAIGELPSMGAA
jgi:hypothetical protein